MFARIPALCLVGIVSILGMEVCNAFIQTGKNVTLADGGDRFVSDEPMLYVWGGNGNDYISVVSPIRIWSGSGNDSIIAKDLITRIQSEDGHDTVTLIDPQPQTFATTGSGSDTIIVKSMKNSDSLHLSVNDFYPDIYPDTVIFEAPVFENLPGGLGRTIRIPGFPQSNDKLILRGIDCSQVDMGRESAVSRTIRYKNTWILIDTDEVSSVTCEGAASAEPILQVRANAETGIVTVPLGTNLRITASVDAGAFAGQNRDWWVWATARVGDSYGEFWFTLDRGWVRSDTPVRTHGGPLFNVPLVTVLETSALPAGRYFFAFALDKKMNDVFEFPETSDGVFVTIE